MTTLVPGSPSPVRLALVIVNAQRKALVSPDCPAHARGDRVDRVRRVNGTTDDTHLWR
jgi:hypothetical protein